LNDLNSQNLNLEIIFLFGKKDLRFKNNK